MGSYSTLEGEQNLPSLEQSEETFLSLITQQYVKQTLHGTQNTNTATSEKPGAYRFFKNMYDLCYFPMVNMLQK